MIHSAASQYNAGVSTEVHPEPDEQNVLEHMLQDTDYMHGPMSKLHFCMQSRPVAVGRFQG